MSPYQLGLTLRLLGPLIQIVGIVLFLGGGEPESRVAGIPTRSAGLGLIAIGLLPVIVGVLLSARRPPRRRGYPGLRLDDETAEPGAQEP